MDSAIVDGTTNSSTFAGSPHIDDVIIGEGIVKRFGRIAALNGLNIHVPRGSVYALLGRNGVGKSTLIQLLMGMLEPSEGMISVLGLDPIKNDVAVKQRLGYIPERMPMYDWMTVDQILSFVSSIYKQWSFEDEVRLVAQFRLLREQKVGVLSRGNRALLSLVIAMAHRPDLVLLDECTSGMDAIARREFERSVIEALSGSGRTVLFAGHQIDEMERICDWVGVIHAGKMLVEMPLDDLKRTVVALQMNNGTSPETIPGCQVLSTRSTGKSATVIAKFDAPLLSLENISHLPQVQEAAALPLEEIFVALMTSADTHRN